MSETSDNQPCWKRWRFLELVIVVVLSIGILASITTSMDLSKPISLKSRYAKKNSFYESLQNEMDTSVDPCDNFYKFACGNYIKNTKISDGLYMDKFTSASAHVVADLYSAIQGLDSSAVSKPFKIVKKYYDTCMNTKHIELEGLRPLIKVLKMLDGWPYLTTRWNKQMFHWETLINRVRKIGFSGDYFIGLSINADPRNFSSLALRLDDPELEFSPDKFSKGLNDPAIKAYYNYMVDVAELLGVARDQAKQDALDVINFEIQLAKLLEYHNSPVQSNKPMRIKDLKRKWQLIDWDVFIKKPLLLFVTINDEDTVIVSNPSYITAFQNLINKTSSRTQKNYVLWKVIKTSVPFLNNKLRKKLTIYKGATNGGVPPKNLRWYTCISGVQDKLKLGADSLYVRSFLKKNSKERVKNMIEDMKGLLLIIIDSAKWLDDNTKNKTIEKMINMESSVAYADELLDDEKMDEYFNGLEIDESSYLQSWLNINLFMMKKICQALRMPFNHTDWTIMDTWTTVNARYVGYANKMEIPAGILRNPFYNSNRPNYMNYGSVGSIIGHEIFHSFDNEQRLFDADTSKLDFKAKVARHQYLRKVTNLVSQYNNYTIEEIGQKINGIKTVQENIADIGGTRLAYVAYQKWITDHGEESRLPDMPYTPNQLFWISAANTWCSVYSTKSLKKFNDGYYAPNNFRVIGTLSNIPEFSRDFNCSRESYMNRRNKCTFW